MSEGNYTAAELLADRVLRAAGSGLRHYSMIGIRAAIVRAAQDGIDAASVSCEGLVGALEFYADPERYKPHPHGPAFDNRDISYVAVAALAKARPASDPTRVDDGTEGRT